jgi:hypothetical protein
MRRNYRFNLKYSLYLLVFLFGLCVICYSQDSIKKAHKLDFSIEKKINYNLYIISSPNPFKTMVRFRLYGLSTINGKAFEFKIYNILGLEIANLSKQANDNNDGSFSDFVVDLTHLNVGIYFVVLTSDLYCNAYKFLKKE